MRQENMCGALIKQLHDELEKKANAMLRGQDLTLSQMNVLMELESADSHQLSLKALEGLLHVAQSTVAGIAIRLEQKGFVESFTDPNDHRVKMIAITTSGLACCQNAVVNMEQMEAQLLHELTESEKILFRDLLAKIFNGL